MSSACSATPRHSVSRRLVTFGIAAVAALGVVVAAPVVGGPSADTPGPVKPGVQDIALGDSTAPAVGAVLTDKATGAVVAPGAAAEPGQQSASAQSPQSQAAEKTLPPGATAESADASASAGASASAASTASPASSAAPAPSTATPVPKAAADPITVTDARSLRLTRSSVAGFASLGVTWTSMTGTGVPVIKARVKVVSTGAWSAWTPLEINDETPNTVPDASKLRSGTDPYWFGDAAGVDVVLDLPSGTDMSDVELTLIDPKQVSQDANPSASRPTDSAGAATAQPPVYTRAQWGADESARSWDPQYASTIKAATIHHTADSNNYSAADVPRIMRSIYAYQAVSRGWGDIGYNVVVDKFGRMWEGRYGGLASTVVGAHAGGFNSYTFGVSILGNYDTTPVPAATAETISQLIAWKFSLYGVSPTSTTVLTQRSGAGTTAKFADGQSVRLPTIFGHRDVGSTVCPGRYGYSILGDVRNRVAQLGARINTVYQRNANTSGGANYTVRRGAPGDSVVACDWNGDKKDTLAYFRRGTWYFFNANPPEKSSSAGVRFGDPGDVPVCGDWNGDGKDTIGLFRPSTQMWYLRNSNTTGPSELRFRWGGGQMIPFAGDWNNDGKDTPGLYDGQTFYVKATASATEGSTRYRYGDPGDKPVVGDWNGDGKDTIGVFRRGVFYLEGTQSSQVTGYKVTFGPTAATPLVGDWDGSRSVTVGAVA